MAHAVLAIGYDDTKYGGCIEIMNSWGDTWGNKGFLSVKYKDFTKFFVGGYAFYIKDTYVKPAAITKTNPSRPKMRGNITPTTINVKNSYKGAIKFNNEDLLKGFKK